MTPKSLVLGLLALITLCSLGLTGYIIRCIYLQTDGGAKARLPKKRSTRKAAVTVPVESTAEPPVVTSDSSLSDAAFLLLCYNRPHYLEETLSSLFAVDGASDVKVYVSQDGSDTPTAEVARRYNVTLWQRPRVPLLGPKQQGQAYLAQHYKWALDKVLVENSHSHAIVLEDDMHFSPDLLSFFRQSAWLLDADPTIWCISTWNDNGFDTLVSDDDAADLFRTDYFPGLGWMLRRELWHELSPLFPREHWDHWMRLASTSRGRECIVPKLSRNYNIGRQGANMEASQYERYLKRIRHNQRSAVPLRGLSGLLNASYESSMATLVARAASNALPLAQPPLSVAPELPGPFLYTYTADTFKRLSAHFGIWPVPRAVHRHTLVLRLQGRTFVLASARQCPYLPSSLREYPPPSLSLVAAHTNEGCDAACSHLGGRCEASLFEFANQVDQLQQHFPCERGFATVVGPDIPNYVVDPSNEYYQRCLITEGGSTCAAKHAATQRLCPCLV